MSLLDPDATPVREAGLGRWFPFSGLLGITVGLLLFIPALFHALGDAVLVFFPSSIMGLAEPQTKGEIAMLLTIEFSFQFILYGLLGLSVGFFLHLARKLGPSLIERLASRKGAASAVPLDQMKTSFSP